MKESFYKSAAEFIKYREKHRESRFIAERLDYMEKYSNSKNNAATSSETDANANVTMKNVANLDSEVYKTTNRIIQRQRMKNKLNELFPEVAKQYEEDLNNHIIYAHDESQSPTIRAYTYSPVEVVEAKYNDLHLLTSLQSLYNEIPCKEILEDSINNVWCKYPSNLYVKDRNDWTKVKVLTKKDRHRNLVRVKTAFGEDIIVTDNHPMITSDDITDTIPAATSLNYKQLRLNCTITFEGVTTIDLADIIECDQIYKNFITTRESKCSPYYYSKRVINVDRNLGYVVGFFIGDGNYDNTYGTIMFTQKEKETLDCLAEKLFDSFGVVSYSNQSTGSNPEIWSMKVCSRTVEQLFRNFFKIKDKAENKCLPYNILMFNEEFALGIIEGLIDSDGTIQENSSVRIRLSSRECIMQLTKLLRYFGFGVANSHQSTPFGNSTRITSNYDIWGVIFTNTPSTAKLTGSHKWNNKITREVSKSLKYSNGWTTITSVKNVTNGSFLDKCYHIYDITTESNTFDCNNLWVHNCLAATLYPLMLEGTGNIDGVTPSPPNDIQSFSGQITNLVFLLSSQVRGAVACLYGEQPLLINGKIIRIKDFVNSKWTTPTIYNDWEYCKINDAKIYEDGKYVNITKVYRKKYFDKIYRFTSHKGFVAATSKDHIFKVLRNGQIAEVRAEDMHLFETVIVNNTIPFEYSSNEYKEGWVKGMLLGDGCISISDSVQLSINYNQDYYGEIFNDYIAELYGGKLNKCKGHKCWNYCTGNRDLIAKLKIDIVGNNTYNKFIDITNKPLIYQVGLLDGILCADGGDYHCIRISLVNKLIIDNIKKILENLHIQYSYREIPKHDNKQMLYCLNIEKSALKYLPNLKLKIKEKKKSESYYHSGYAKVRKSRRGTNEYIESNGKGHYQFPQYTTDVITNIETFDNTDDYVYEIETSTHWYNCGGFITHNCGDYIVALCYYVNLEFGPDWYKKLDTITTTSCNTKQRTIKDVIRKGMKQFIYGVNQPAGNRSYNSPFSNLNFFDRYYYEALFGEFYYPDGTKPKWEAVDCLQRMFVELLRELRLIKPLTFPVTSICMLHDNEKCLDEDCRQWVADEWAKGSSFFLYLSNNPTSISSCCFSKDTKVLCKSSFGIHWDTFENIKSIKTTDKSNFTIFHNGSWCKGKIISLPNRPMYKITTANNKEIIVSDNHLNPTLRGNICTSELTTKDYLLFNTSKLDSFPEKDEYLTYEQGFLIGAFLGDGCFSKRYKDGIIYDIILSQNALKYQKCMEAVNQAATDTLGPERAHVCLGTVHNNVYPLRISSKELVAFIQKWTNWHEGTMCHNKELNMECLFQSYNFRKGILDGWYNTDGGNSNRCYTTSTKLKDCMEVLITSLGLNSIIDYSDRTDEKVVIRGIEYNRNYPLWCVRWYDTGNKRSMKDVFIWRNNSIYFKIKSIEPVEYKDKIYCCEMRNQDEPYFTLPNGIITHNCRVQNEITENTFSSTIGLTGIMTGSANVITLNLNRIVQDYFRLFPEDCNINCLLDDKSKGYPLLKKYLTNILERVYKYQIAYKTMVYEMEEKGMYSCSNAGYIYMKKLYCTIGVIGYCEAAQFLGYKITDNQEYKNFLKVIFETIQEENKKHSIHDKKRPFIFNTEAIPGENLAVKLYEWDKADGYIVPEDQNLYSSYFFRQWDESLSVLDKLRLHNKDVNQYCGGGLDISLAS